jgi:hypothetical protein
MGKMSKLDNRFSDFVIMQAQNAGLFLGQVPHPISKKKEVNLKAAASVIESLKMLKDKTLGNLSEEESKLLDSALNNITKLFSKVSEEP